MLLDDVASLIPIGREARAAGFSAFATRVVLEAEDKDRKHKQDGIRLSIRHDAELST